MKILLLHGWGVQAPDKITKLADALKGKGHEVYVPHMPGFGRQEPPLTPWDVGGYVDWVIAQLAAKGWESCVVVGHSFGGRVAIKLAVTHPEKVFKLVLLASAGLKHPLSFKSRLIQLVGQTGKAFFSLPVLSWVRPSVHSFWRTVLKHKDYYQASGVMRKTFLRVVGEDLREIVSQIHMSTLIIWGKKDQFVPVQDAYFLHEHIAGSRLKVLSQGDHFVPYNYPEEIAEEIDDFIKEETSKTKVSL